MEGKRHSLRLLAGALLTFGGLAAIAVGVAIGIATPPVPVCAPASGPPCVAGPAVPPVADGPHRITTD